MSFLFCHYFVVQHLAHSTDFKLMTHTPEIGAGFSYQIASGTKNRRWKSTE